MTAFRQVQLADLSIEDEDSVRHIALYRDVKDAMLDAKVTFLVPDSPISSDQAVFLNLAYWSEGDAGVLEDDSIFADVVLHTGLHHLTERHVRPSLEAELLGESIASAIDVYLIGRMLGNAPDASFLATQVPRMRDVAEANGVDDETFASWLEEMESGPERAFEDLRSLLFDASTKLAMAKTVNEASAVLDGMSSRRFFALLHHFELPTWIMRSRSRVTEAPAGDTRMSARDLDAALRGANDSIALLASHWFDDASVPQPSPTRAEGDRVPHD